jgi:hypothetical protein
VFKAALKELDEYDDQLPAEIKALGVMAFAHYPPAELENLVVELSDKHMRPDWRDDADPAKAPEHAWTISAMRSFFG